MSTAGGDIMSAQVQLIAMTLQTIIYYAISCIAIFIENWIIKHKEMLLEARNKIAAKAGIDLDEDRRIIAGKSD
jgi:hypothetical protein